MKKLYFLALSIFASASLMATQVQVQAVDNLQAAVNAANSGDTVLVQAGTYEGNFTMKDGVYVSGGWNEDFTAQTKHASILDAKASGRVLNQPDTFNTLTIWDNFTIQVDCCRKSKFGFWCCFDAEGSCDQLPYSEQYL